MNKAIGIGIIAGMMAFCIACAASAQEAGEGGGGGEAAAPAAVSSGSGEAAAPGTIVPTAGARKAKPKVRANDFRAVLFGSGWLGFLLWLALFSCAGAGVYFSVDSFITVRPKRILPQKLVDEVTAAMAEGDVMKALQRCENEPGPLANVLSAGFSHVEEGFEVIQDAVATAADLETEKIMQKLTWISVCANLAPMLGLLGTVQGMIMAFATIAEGAPDVGLLALAISQALYTTAGGLTIAIPCVTVFYNLRNSANRSFLKMEAMTMELIKDLRNVEVVES